MVSTIVSDHTSCEMVPSNSFEINSIFSIIVWYIPFFLLIYFIYSSDTIQVATIKIKNTWSKLSAVKSLVASQHKNIFKIIFYTIKTVFKTAWIIFLQKVNNNVVKVGKTHYIISYVIAGRIYKIKVLSPRGPENITMIIDENSEEVTDEIAPFLRAQRNMIHHFSPSSFQKDNLQIFTSDEADPYIFSKTENMLFKNDIASLGKMINPINTTSNDDVMDPIQNLLGNVFSMITSESVGNNIKLNNKISQNNKKLE